jgi:hypothetical protein
MGGQQPEPGREQSPPRPKPAIGEQCARRGTAADAVHGFATRSPGGVSEQRLPRALWERRVQAVGGRKTLGHRVNDQP